MGVYVDQYVGYVVEVTPILGEAIEKFGNNMRTLLGEDVFKEKYIDNEDVFRTIFDDGDDIPDALKKLRVKGHYGEEQPGPGDIELLRDGMNGNYNYLIYIKEVERYSNNEEEPSRYINEMLRQVPVPMEVIDKVGAVYEYLFHKKLDSKQIYLQQIAHFH